MLHSALHVSSLVNRDLQVLLTIYPILQDSTTSDLCSAADGPSSALVNAASGADRWPPVCIGTCKQSNECERGNSSWRRISSVRQPGSGVVHGFGAGRSSSSMLQQRGAMDHKQRPCVCSGLDTTSQGHVPVHPVRLLKPKV